ncbi:glycoside-pentoside-hexuronide (GPH):cation symporter [Pelagicoccus albus]|uniref:MFS transporter n=1 Tax=Pelagicoccus albus TaxID=415222 RepID=A0A7X1BA78_9BACT|nr:glycoside-pentoside-hexuronide (GPH):cation symporter [Pelagicoccus albus]MBC2607273.1 MFS transporter [Pelagicoccus albus]
MNVASPSKWTQRVGYGSADFACNLVWQMITLYLMFFYTDVMNLSPAQVGTLFLLTRVIDGVTDVLMGLLIDKTDTKWGKSRPYLLFGSIPFGVFAVLAFHVPEASPTGMLIYAYITYIGLSASYTLVNIPLTSILPSLTGDPQERTVLATTRIVFSFVGATVVGVAAQPMVQRFGGEDSSSGYLITMLIFAIVSVALFVFTFSTVRERVEVHQKKLSAKDAFSAIKGNHPWMIFALNIVFMWGSYFFQMGALIYYFTYNVGDPQLGAIIAGIASFVPIAGTFVTPTLTHFMMKRTVFMIGSGVNLAGLFFLIAAGDHRNLIIVAAVVTWLGHGLRQAIYFSMQADPVDYGEWKSGVSAAGLLSSINGFIGKLAMAGSGAVAAWLLTSANYVANQDQTSEALFAIKLNYLLIPAGLVILSIITMCFYRLDKIYPKIRRELDDRHSNSSEKPA